MVIVCLFRSLFILPCHGNLAYKDHNSDLGLLLDSHWVCPMRAKIRYEKKGRKGKSMCLLLFLHFWNGCLLTHHPLPTTHREGCKSSLYSSDSLSLPSAQGRVIFLDSNYPGMLSYLLQFPFNVQTPLENSLLIKLFSCYLHSVCHLSPSLTWTNQDRNSYFIYCILVKSHNFSK